MELQYRTCNFRDGSKVSKDIQESVTRSVAEIETKAQKKEKEKEMAARQSIVTRAGMFSQATEAGRQDLETWIDNPSKNEPAIRVMRDERDKFRAGVSQALLYRAGYEPMDRQNEHNSDTLKDVVIECLKARGEKVDYRNWITLIDRAFATSDFQAIASNVSGKAMLEGFNSVPTTFQSWVREMDVQDFQEQTLVGLSEFSGIPRLPDGGTIQCAKASDYKETFHLDTYAARFPVSRQAIANDDIGILTTVPNGLGQAARITQNDAVYQKLTANPKTGDGKELFSVEHGNLGTAGTLNSTMIDSVRAAMGQQRDQNGVRLRVTPDVILTPVRLQGTLNQIMSVQYVPNEAGQVNQVNVVQGLSKIISDATLDDLDDSIFYAVCSRYPGIIVAYLKNSNRQPRIEQVESRLFDGIEYKVTFDFGICAANHRTLYKGIVA